MAEAAIVKQLTAELKKRNVTVCTGRMLSNGKIAPYEHFIVDSNDLTSILTRFIGMRPIILSDIDIVSMGDGTHKVSYYAYCYY